QVVVETFGLKRESVVALDRRQRVSERGTAGNRRVSEQHQNQGGRDGHRDANANLFHPALIVRRGSSVIHPVAEDVALPICWIRSISARANRAASSEVAPDAISPPRNAVSVSRSA